MVMAATRNRNPWTSTCQRVHRIGKMIWWTADVPHQLPGNAQTQLQALCTRPLCFKAEKVYQHLFQALLRQTFPRNNPHIRHAVTEVRRNGHRGLMLHQCHHRSHQARLLLHKNYVKQRGSPFGGTKNKQTQDLHPLMPVEMPVEILVEMLVEIFHRVRLAYGDGHSPRRRDQVLATRAQKAERVVNDLGTATWTASMIGVSNAKAVDKTPIPQTDANIVASVPSVIATANVAETAMGTVNGTRSTVNASGTLNATETDAIVSGTETGNEIANETANEVTGIDGTKRIAIAKVGRTVTSVVELFSPPLRTAVSLFEPVIVPQPLLRTSWGSEEDLPMMTYVSPLPRVCYFYSSRPVMSF
jgi:hypothetical protein